MSFGGGDIHVRGDLDIQAYRAGSVADRASEVPGVVREISCSVLLLFCIWGSGIELAKLIMDIGVGGYCGPDIDADRGGVNQFDPLYARGLYGLDMGWQFDSASVMMRVAIVTQRHQIVRGVTACLP